MIVVDYLAQCIRKVDGSNKLGAGALAEALMPYITPCGGCGVLVKEHCNRQEYNCFRAFHGGKFEKEEIV